MKKTFLALYLSSIMFSTYALAENKLYENCIDNVSISNSKGNHLYLDLCIATNKQYDKFQFADTIIFLSTSLSSEELSTLGGKSMFKETIKDKLQSSSTVYFSKFTIKNEVCK